eukprot:TRINITY_DN1201_c0_g1_i1.p1 TRINITY_DN1201_c0_g1~~TRINITY_DN1201_c0_g1_i1.p1  ORF type:complete len:375 (+),score=77.20 TRINITY_DN1201_c0_g1_i1:468-1592(+)
MLRITSLSDRELSAESTDYNFEDFVIEFETTRDDQFLVELRILNEFYDDQIGYAVLQCNEMLWENREYNFWLKMRFTNRSFLELAARYPNVNYFVNLSVSFQSEYYLEDTFDFYYNLGKVIGDGSFSKVHLATNKDSGEVFAVKVIDISGENASRVEGIYREIEINNMLKSDYFIRLVDQFHEESAIYLVFELAKGGELFEYVAQRHFILPEKTARDIIHQILSGTAFMHSSNIVHRDLKLENIVIMDEDITIKIIDFGLSVDTNRTTPCYPCGSPEYLAPEILLSKPYDGAAADMWAIGVIAFMLLGGYPPFTGTIHEMFHKIYKGEYSFDGQIWESISDEAKDFIKRLLCRSPKRRLTAEQGLESPWITGNI